MKPIVEVTGPRQASSRRRATLIAAGVAMMGLLIAPRSVHAQDPGTEFLSLSEVLSFLVTNRSIATDDFVRDEAAAAATRDTVAGFMALELATLPIAASAGGFAYRLDPALGVAVRSSDSFGPFFTERALTVGGRHVSYSLSHRRAAFTNLGGRPLRNGTLVSTASTLAGEAAPFDIETVSLDVAMNVVTATGTFGLTDRLDVGVALPFARVSLRGQRVDTYRGRPLVQASGIGSALGLSDITLRMKFHAVGSNASGVAIGADARLPTGDKNNLLGAGKLSVMPRIVASRETERLGLHAEVGYTWLGVAEGLRYSGAVTLAATPRVTLVGEVSGNQLSGLLDLEETTQPHPRVPNVSTIRLTGTEGTIRRAFAVGGFKWTVAGAWVVSANVLTPLTDSGLNAKWVPTAMVEYAFRR